LPFSACTGNAGLAPSLGRERAIVPAARARCDNRARRNWNLPLRSAISPPEAIGQEGKMNRTIICAAVAAAMLTLAVPAQAMTADPGLNASAPATVQQARYRHHDERWRHSYAYSPHRHRHCRSERVRTWGHHWAWVRRCGW